MQKGLFVTFEGTDGSGKSTQIQLLKNFFELNNINAIFTREPGGTLISEKIRNLVIDKDNKMTDSTEAYLYAASRNEHILKIIKPALLNSKIVICDRFLDSSLAYQGFGRGLGTDVILEINNYAVKNFMPDITFFMDVAPQIAIKRRHNASTLDRIELEKIEFHQKVYDGFKKLSKIYSDRYVVIDATNTIESIHNKIIDKLKEVVL